MRSGISAIALLVAVGCGGRTILDDGTSALEPSDGGRNVGVDGSLLVDGATGATGDGASKEDATADAEGPPTISCGKATCDPATEVCCASTMAQSCTAKGKCTTGVAVSCTSSASCSAGQVCCAAFSFGGGGLAGAGGLPGGGLAGGGLAGGGLAGGGLAGGGAAGTGGLTGGFTITVDCAKNCTAGFQLCGSDAECPMGDTCQTQPGLGQKICSGANNGFPGTGDGGLAGFGGIPGAGGTAGQGGFPGAMGGMAGFGGLPGGGAGGFPGGGAGGFPGGGGAGGMPGRGGGMPGGGGGMPGASSGGN